MLLSKIDALVQLNSQNELLRNLRKISWKISMMNSLQISVGIFQTSLKHLCIVGYTKNNFEEVV